MFVLIYPFISQIFCINNDIMKRFTDNEKKIKMTIKSISHPGKKARTSAKSEKPNRKIV